LSTNRTARIPAVRGVAVDPDVVDEQRLRRRDAQPLQRDRVDLGVGLADADER